MKTETTEKQVMNGEVFFDANCPICVFGARRLSGFFGRRGFRWSPLQTAGTAERLIISDAELRSEMKLLHLKGKVIGGIDTWIFLLRTVWWLWPLGMFLRLPGIHLLADSIYRWLARKRNCFSGSCGGNNSTERHRVFFKFP